MKKKYTKKQITEAIRYWQTQLHRMNENVATDSWNTNADGFQEIPDSSMDKGLDAVLSDIGKTRNDITQIYFGLDHWSRNSGGDYYKKGTPEFNRALNNLCKDWNEYVGKGVPVEGYDGEEIASEGPTWLSDNGTLNVPVSYTNAYTLYFV